MTDSTKTRTLYPKKHLLAASSVAALLGLALLVPSIAPRISGTASAIDSSATKQSHQAAVAAPMGIAAATQQAHPEALPGGTAAEASQAPAAPQALPAVTPLGVPPTDNNPLAKINSLATAREILSGQSAQDQSALPRDIMRPRFQERYARLVIRDSLSVTAQSAGLPQSLVAGLTQIFHNRIDIAKSMHPGDQVELIFQEKIADSTRVAAGPILAARLTHQGKNYIAIRYHDKQGKAAYYAGNGENLSRDRQLLSFLRTPVASARISSVFSSGRKHPVLGRVRPHKGVDFAAAAGTPIKATADGKIFLAGRQGGYGNVIIIQHAGRYRTLYGHMKAFARGIRPGVPVKQGQVIGYIGSTGLSTGPHVHYEFQINRQPVNPLTQQLAMHTDQPSNALPFAEQQKFRQLRQLLLARMDRQKATALAMNRYYYLR